jgi:hypothetical protein
MVVRQQIAARRHDMKVYVEAESHFANEALVQPKEARYTPGYCSDL